MHIYISLSLSLAVSLSLSLIIFSFWKSHLWVYPIFRYTHMLRTQIAEKHWMFDDVGGCFILKKPPEQIRYSYGDVSTPISLYDFWVKIEDIHLPAILGVHHRVHHGFSPPYRWPIPVDSRRKTVVSLRRSSPPVGTAACPATRRRRAAPLGSFG